MTDSFVRDLLQDAGTASLAQAVLVAKQRAREVGIKPEDNYLTVTQTGDDTSAIWRINFVPKTPKFRRDGDYMVDVNAVDSSIRQELWGQ